MRNSVITVSELECECRSLLPFYISDNKKVKLRDYCLWVGCHLITVDLPIIQSKVFLHLYPVFRWIWKTSFPLIKLKYWRIFVSLYIFNVERMFLASHASAQKIFSMVI
jgi:hypothetical protein